MTLETKPRTDMLSTTGVRPLTPTFFFDFDHTDFSEILTWSKDVLLIFDIYQSSNDLENPRYHVVAPFLSWDGVQNALQLCKQRFPKEHYIMNCRRLRLRITAKTTATGVEVVPPPRLIMCGCQGIHVERRIGTLEAYSTKW